MLCHDLIDLSMTTEEAWMFTYLRANEARCLRVAQENIRRTVQCWDRLVPTVTVTRKRGVTSRSRLPRHTERRHTEPTSHGGDGVTRGPVTKSAGRRRSADRRRRT